MPVLFTGRSSHDRLTAAEAIASDLGVDILRVDLRAVAGKYVGETEKNLDVVFTEAADTGAILFFDEADPLFGKRSRVKDSHDRYANVDVDALLHRIESYPGIAILATNLRQDIDQAFIRRMTFVVDLDAE
jgi:SpoVK/Ycf46/Vps4 family AAA+-type ATPase